MCLSGPLTRLACCCALLLWLSAARVHAQPPAGFDFDAVGTEPLRLATGFHFTEGPCVDGAGDVWFSDGEPARRIHRWRAGAVPEEQPRVQRIVENSGWADGMAFDARGRLLTCEVATRRVAARTIDAAATASARVETLAAEFDDKPLNSPNDLWIDAGGGIYFTDPRYGVQTGVVQDGFHLYYLPPGGGAVVRAADDLQRPNGVIGTGDGRWLYVADEGAGVIFRYAIEAPGRLGARTLFARRGAIGLRLDARGNLYAALQDIVVFAPDGRELARMEFPEMASHLAFVGPHGEWMFVTASTSVYLCRLPDAVK